MMAKGTPQSFLQLVLILPHLESPVQRRVFSEIDDYFVGGFAQPTTINDRDEYDDWLARAGHPEDVQGR
jgi:hypothetical protein